MARTKLDRLPSEMAPGPHPHPHPAYLPWGSFRGVYRNTERLFQGVSGSQDLLRGLEHLAGNL